MMGFQVEEYGMQLLEMRSDKLRLDSDFLTPQCSRHVLVGVQEIESDKIPWQAGVGRTGMCFFDKNLFREVLCMYDYIKCDYTWRCFEDACKRQSQVCMTKVHRFLDRDESRGWRRESYPRGNGQVFAFLGCWENFLWSRHRSCQSIAHSARNEILEDKLA